MPHPAPYTTNDAPKEDSFPQTRIVLVGDSTVTDKSEDRDQAGWGWALRFQLSPHTQLMNTAVGGRSSRSFRSEGRWDRALSYQPHWVVIQFGHNDEPGKGPERESPAASDYRDHLRNYIHEARHQSASPVLVTPVCRRTYADASTLIDTLAPYAESVRIVAHQLQVPLIDLHQYSFATFSQMSPDASQKFAPPHDRNDRTHFSTYGSKIVAQWVLALMQTSAPELAACFTATNRHV